MKRIALLVVTMVVALGSLVGCSSDSDVASKNLSKDADNYKVFRQIVVYNAITDKYILEVNGFCALGNADSAGQVSYTCKTSEGIVKDIIKKSDNTFVFVHQLSPRNVSTDRYTVVLKPEEILPKYEIR